MSKPSIRCRQRLLCCNQPTTRYHPAPAGEIDGLYLFRQAPGETKANLYRDLQIDSRLAVDTDVKKDQSYTYYLRVLDKKGNASKPGKAVSVKFQPPAK